MPLTLTHLLPFEIPKLKRFESERRDDARLREEMQRAIQRHDLTTIVECVLSGADPPVDDTTPRIFLSVEKVWLNCEMIKFISWVNRRRYASEKCAQFIARLEKDLCAMIATWLI